MKKSERRSVIPEDFKVSDQIRRWAIEHEMPNPDLHLEAFIDSSRSKGTLFADFDAGFRTWLRNQKKWYPNSPESRPYKPPLQAPRKPQVEVSFPEEEKTKPEDLKVMMAQLDEVLSKVGNGGVPKPTTDEAERRQKLLEQARKLGVKL